MQSYSIKVFKQKSLIKIHFLPSICLCVKASWGCLKFVYYSSNAGPVFDLLIYFVLQIMLACTGFLSANFVGFLNAVENKWKIKLYCIQYYRKRSYITMLMHVVVSTLSNHGRMTIWQSQIFALNEEI
jgi:hypothetical protein